MLKRAMLMTGVTLLAGCATDQPQPTPYEAPPPVEITESAPPQDAPPPDAPPPQMSGKPQQTDSGLFRVSVASLDSAEVAAPWVKKAEAAGYRTEVLAVEIAGKTWHRVLLPGYASLAEAQAALPFIQQELGAPDAWVTSRRPAPGPEDSVPAEAPAPPPPAPEPPPEQPAN